MSLWDDYKVDAQFTMDFTHGVNNDEWRTREGKVLKVKDMCRWFYECGLKEGFTPKQAMELADSYIIALFGSKK